MDLDLEKLDQLRAQKRTTAFRPAAGPRPRPGRAATQDNCHTQVHGGAIPEAWPSTTTAPPATSKPATSANATSALVQQDPSHTAQRNNPLGAASAAAGVKPGLSAIRPGPLPSAQAQPVLPTEPSTSRLPVPAVAAGPQCTAPDAQTCLTGGKHEGSPAPHAVVATLFPSSQVQESQAFPSSLHPTQPASQAVSQLGAVCQKSEGQQVSVGQEGLLAVAARMQHAGRPLLAPHIVRQEALQAAAHAAPETCTQVHGRGQVVGNQASQAAAGYQTQAETGIAQPASPTQLPIPASPTPAAASAGDSAAAAGVAGSIRSGAVLQPQSHMPIGLDALESLPKKQRRFAPAASLAAGRHPAASPPAQLAAGHAASQPVTAAAAVQCPSTQGVMTMMMMPASGVHDGPQQQATAAAGPAGAGAVPAAAPGLAASTPADAQPLARTKATLRAGLGRTQGGAPDVLAAAEALAGMHKPAARKGASKLHSVAQMEMEGAEGSTVLEDEQAAEGEETGSDVGRSKRPKTKAAKAQAKKTRSTSKAGKAAKASVILTLRGAAAGAEDAEADEPMVVVPCSGLDAEADAGVAVLAPPAKRRKSVGGSKRGSAGAQTLGRQEQAMQSDADAEPVGGASDTDAEILLSLAAGHADGACAVQRPRQARVHAAVAAGAAAVVLDAGGAVLEVLTKPLTALQAQRAAHSWQLLLRHTHYAAACAQGRTDVPCPPAATAADGAGIRVRVRPSRTRPPAAAGGSGSVDAEGVDACEAGTSGALVLAGDDGDALEVTRAAMRARARVRRPSSVGALVASNTRAALRSAGLQEQPMPSVDLSQAPDLQAWPLRKIIAWSQAKDKQAEKVYRQEEAAAAAAAAAEASSGRAGRLETAGGHAAGGMPMLEMSDGAGVHGQEGGGTAAAAMAQQQQHENAGGAPQVCVDEHGNMIINQATLTMQAQQAEVDTYTRVNEDTRFVNYSSYRGGKWAAAKGATWSGPDTLMFYKALAHFGTDFSLIAQLFPGRDRRHIKNKYTKELRELPSRVDTLVCGGTAAQSLLAGLEETYALPPHAGAARVGAGGRASGSTPRLTGSQAPTPSVSGVSSRSGRGGAAAALHAPQGAYAGLGGAAQGAPCSGEGRYAAVRDELGALIRSNIQAQAEAAAATAEATAAAAAAVAELAALPAPGDEEEEEGAGGAGGGGVTGGGSGGLGSRHGTPAPAGAAAAAGVEGDGGGVVAGMQQEGEEGEEVGGEGVYDAAWHEEQHEDVHMSVFNAYGHGEDDLDAYA